MCVIRMPNGRFVKFGRKGTTKTINMAEYFKSKDDAREWLKRQGINDDSLIVKLADL